MAGEEMMGKVKLSEKKSLACHIGEECLRESNKHGGKEDRAKGNINCDKLKKKRDCEDGMEGKRLIKV